MPRIASTANPGDHACAHQRPHERPGLIESLVDREHRPAAKRHARLSGNQRRRTTHAALGFDWRVNILVISTKDLVANYLNP
jgi:hypothetical protein